MDHNITKRYSNGEVTVVWRPALCQHSGICARDSRWSSIQAAPWIELQHADSPTITAQVERCPSGALTSVKDPIA